MFPLDHQSKDQKSAVNTWHLYLISPTVWSLLMLRLFLYVALLDTFTPSTWSSACPRGRGWVSSRGSAVSVTGVVVVVGLASEKQTHSTNHEMEEEWCKDLVYSALFLHLSTDLWRPKIYPSTPPVPMPVQKLFPVPGAARPPGYCCPWV